MSCVFQNIDPPPPSPHGECVPPRLCCGGRTHSPGGEGGGGSIFWKTQDTALYSTYIESSLANSHKRNEFPYGLQTSFLTTESLRKNGLQYTVQEQYRYWARLDMIIGDIPQNILSLLALKRVPCS